MQKAGLNHSLRALLPGLASLAAAVLQHVGRPQLLLLLAVRVLMLRLLLLLLLLLLVLFLFSLVQQTYRSGGVVGAFRCSTQPSLGGKQRQRD